MKYYVTADIHGFYSVFYKALDSCSEKGKAIGQGMKYCRWHIQDQVVSFGPDQEDEHVRDKKN